jgi:xanthine dehydrogenase small subunit
VLAPDEVLAWIKVPCPHPNPLPQAGEGANAGGRGEGPERRHLLRAYKISKRFDDDISAVCLVVNMTLDHGTVTDVSIGAGGVAPTPARALRTETALLGQPWAAAAAHQAAAALRDEFQPISDMRASASYRSQVLGNLMQRFWLESQGVRQINLESASWFADPGSTAAEHSQ